MIYGYCRATTPKQLETGYLDEQENKIKERYFDSIIFKEKTLDIKEKPEYKKSINLLVSGDTFVVTKLDRFASSITDAFETIKFLKERNIKVHILNIGLIDNSILGEVLFKSLEAVYDFEKALLVERIQSGKNKAKKQNGFREGRPKKYSDKEIKNALELLKSYSYKKVEEMTGISKSTLIRAKKEFL